ncbi:hypothetical protein ZOSMA_214G00380 [Zostera marina]|uniref:Transmembrane protein n=1 Tax=Zostera marina TaxID=29655 RepID=A0A0K9PMI6_ZOSMR|nr:hypothetical protein ZOSMA_214G00380 [Zostera marina]
MMTKGGDRSWVSEIKPMPGGDQEHSWKPVTTGNTTSLDYWLNWRFSLCAGSVISSMIISFILIRRYEGLGQENKAESQRQMKQKETDHVGTVYDDDSWRPCLKYIHPAWLLAFRLTAFFVLSGLLTVYVSIEGTQTFYYYTQWTFGFDIVYFGLGSLLSIYGCRQFCKEVNDIRVDQFEPDEEQKGTYVVARLEINTRSKGGGNTADIWGYLFQIIFQINAGAVVLTDLIFWVIFVPFLEMKQYNVNLLMIVMHSVNAVFLLGDVAINSLRFPVFRIAYFLLWTGIYVLFQWIVHAFISFWYGLHFFVLFFSKDEENQETAYFGLSRWPYPFLDVSSQYSPLWYLLVAVLHLPSYAIFFLIIKTKHWMLSRCFPYSHTLYVFEK